MTYTYDPSNISGWSKDRMRFELGDTQIVGEGDTCALCDEEYNSLIPGTIDSLTGWRKAKIECLKAIVARFSMAADYNAGGISIELSQRYDRWKKILEEEEAHIKTIGFSPSMMGKGSSDGGHYFWFGQHDNHRAGW